MIQTAVPSPAMTILAVGAHPDDIEIGAAGLLEKARELGCRRWILILTDDAPHRDTRRAEAVESAKRLGVPPDQVLFAGLRDGHLRADGDSVSAIRALASEHGVDPDLVVAHSAADSHNDHVEAGRLARAAFREAALLHFAVHLSVEDGAFFPDIFVGLAPPRGDRKRKALGCFVSQAERIERRSLAEFEERLGRVAGLGRAEGFEFGGRAMTGEMSARILALSDSPFHRFWAPVMALGPATLIGQTEGDDGRPDIRSCEAVDRLRRAFFDRWVPSYPLWESHAVSPGAWKALSEGSVVLFGPVQNHPVIAKLIEDERPAWAAFPGRAGSSESAVVTMENPHCDGALIVVATGTDSAAAVRALESITEPVGDPHPDMLVREANRSSAVQCP
ncbi:PIG-L deacetylase family protein [Salininema proteolyticum]|uniref:PIG-L deacetylase family protein n=1 Tax=Salininema proteolyticum TaxID=1607685 RepID=A0ABV8U2E1_9ACTN